MTNEEIERALRAAASKSPENQDEVFVVAQPEDAFNAKNLQDLSEILAKIEEHRNSTEVEQND